MSNQVFEPKIDQPQQVVCKELNDRTLALICINSTALGPALGGLRFYPYASIEDAREDVTRLAQAMSYKNALAGLSFGGGKAVIVGDPEIDKTPRLLERFGQLVESLHGNYLTACDVGTTVSDMDVIARTCTHVLSRSAALGGAGDPSVLTSYGVYRAMQACAMRRWGIPSLYGRRVGISGVGKVGALLARRLSEAGAQVVVTDVRKPSVDAVIAANPRVEAVADTDTLLRADLDVFAPCALGGVLTEMTVSRMRAPIVCGAANNQLAEDRVDAWLREAGILYAPDYVVNAGGVIQVADERSGRGFDFERARRRTDRIFDTTSQVLELAAEHGIPTAEAADLLARRKLVNS